MKRRFVALAVSMVMLVSQVLTLLPALEVEAATSYEQQLINAGFPQSYATKLAELHELHPTWNFEPLLVTKAKPKYTWDYVISQELADDERNLIYYSYSASDYALDSTLVESGLWRKCTEATVEYFMDPRNFLDEVRIFQFEALQFTDNTYTVNDVANSIKGTFMEGKTLENGKTYAQHLYDVGKSVGVNPFHLAARIKQEQGLGQSPLISGTCGTTLAQCYANKTNGAPATGYDGFNFAQYNGLYNYFNMGAFGTGYFEIWLNGMKEAQTGGWNTRYKSIQGGAKKVYDTYISQYQNTLYLQKFNVHPSSSKNFWGQYMQNVSAAWSESLTIHDAYANNGLLDTAFTFIIPVFDGMPSACNDPGGAFVSKATYVNNIDFPISKGGTSKSVVGSCVVSKDSSSDMLVRGWSVHSEGVSKYQYAFDDGAWVTFSDEGGYRADVAQAMPSYTNCTTKNSFAKSVDISQMTAGIHKLTIRGLTKKNVNYLIAVIEVKITAQPQAYSTVALAFAGKSGGNTSGYAYDFDAHTSGANLLDTDSAFTQGFIGNAATDTSSISATSALAAKITGFSQAYSAARWQCQNQISVDLKMVTSGSNFCGFVVKYGEEIPSGISQSSLFFENDGCRSDESNSTTGASGIAFAFRTVDNVTGIEILVKYLDSTGKLCVAGQFFPNPVENIKEFNNYKVTDDNNGTVNFYANDILFATVVCSDAKIPTVSDKYGEKYFSNAVIKDAQGTTLSTVTNALVSEQSALAFGTRSQTMEIDNLNILDWNGTAPEPEPEVKPDVFELDGQALLLTNDITVRYLVDKAKCDRMGYQNPVLIIGFGGEETILQANQLTIDGVECYVFSFGNLAPQMMNDSIYATLSAEKDNEVVKSETKETSIADYMYAQLATTTDSKLRTLLVDMLHYGSYAQIYTRYNTFNLVDKQLTDEQAAWGTQALRELVSHASEPDYNGDAKWLGMRLKLSNKVNIEGFFNAPITEGMYIKVTDADNNLIQKIQQNEFLMEAGTTDNTAYSFVFDKLTIKQMSDTIGFTIYNAQDENISGTYFYSVESYVQRNQDTTDNGFLNLMNAMMMYGDAARAYAG